MSEKDIDEKLMMEADPDGYLRELQHRLDEIGAKLCIALADSIYLNLNLQVSRQEADSRLRRIRAISEIVKKIRGFERTADNKNIFLPEAVLVELEAWC